MKIVYFGTPEFAVAPLNLLIENNYNVVAVVTAPDQPAGRGLQLKHSAVKTYAIAKGFRLLQPVKMRDESFLKELQSLNADLFIVVAFRMLPEVVWQMPPKGTFNLHASLLPQYRGAAPINHAIINGETVTGVTTFFLKHEIDTGSILLQQSVEINPDDDAGTLHDKLMQCGAALVLKTVNMIETGEARPVEQEQFITDKSLLKHAPKIFKENCRINWNMDGIKIHNLIRGLSPYPSAFTEFVLDKTVIPFKIYKTKFEPDVTLVSSAEPVTDGKTFFKIACIGGWLHVLDVQQAGKKRLHIDEFLRGFKSADALRIK